MPQLGSQVLSAPISSLSSRAEHVVTEEWSLRLRFSQVILMWSTIGLAMVGVFLFGLYAGKRQGIEEALLEQRDQVVRFPLPPIATMPKPAAPLDTAMNALPLHSAETVTEQKPTSVSPTPPTNEVARAANSETTAAKTSSLVPEAVPVEKTAGASASPSVPAAAPGFAAKSAESVLLASNQVAPLAASSTPSAFENKNKTESIGESAKLRGRLGTAAETTTQAPKASALISSSTETRTSAPQKLVKEKPKAAAQAAAEESAPRAMAKGWYVQLAATKSTTDAASLTRKLKSKGVNPVIQTVKVGNEDYTRVLVGPFSGKDGASSSRKKIGSLGVTKGEPFLKYLGG